MIGYEKNNALLFDSARAKRLYMRKEKFNALIPELGTETAYGLYDLYSLYDEDIYVWLSDLYQPNIGGFYYSNSARDTEGYLPDIESTAQAMSILSMSNMLVDYQGKYGDAIPEDMRDAMLEFALLLQDE